MIRLQSLKISRFRGVREGTITGLADVNVLIGRNNSGKSTIAEAITRVAYHIVKLDRDILNRQLHDIWNNPRYEQGGYPPELWFRQDRSEPIILQAQLGTAPLSVKVVAQENGATWEVSHSLNPGGPNLNAEAKFLAGVAVFRPPDALNRVVEQSLWPQLIAKRRDKVLTQALNNVFGLDAEGFNVLQDGKLLVLFADHGIPLDGQGDGTRAVMRTLMVLSAQKGTLLLLEEPECHQHPGSLERFAQALCNVAHEQDVQLIISTHSAECVGAFLKGAQGTGSESAVFHLTLSDGQQQARRLDPETVETLQATGVDVRFLDLYG